MSTDEISRERFKIMERKLFYGIMAPGAILTLLSGGWLISNAFALYVHQEWMQVKLALVFLLLIFHIYCGKLYQDFKYDRNKHSHVFYRWLNEVPVLFLAGIIISAIVKPFTT